MLAKNKLPLAIMHTVNTRSSSISLTAMRVNQPSDGSGMSAIGGARTSEYAYENNTSHRMNQQCAANGTYDGALPR